MTNHRLLSYLLFVLLAYSLGICEAAGQATATSYPTGAQPRGIGIIGDYVVIANSGDNSVSIFKTNLTAQTATLSLVTIVPGIPSPYGVFSCEFGFAFVTSPSDNSIRRIHLPDGQIVANAKTGLQPYSGTCWNGITTSNSGDNTLTTFDPSLTQLVQTKPDIPGARGKHWFATRTNMISGVFDAVASVDSNVVTILNGDRKASVPVSRPIWIDIVGLPMSLMIFSAAPNNLIEISSEVSVNSPPGARTIQTFPELPNAQDVERISSGTTTGWAVTSGDFIWMQLGNNTTTVPGIPGAGQIASIGLPPAADGSTRQVLLVVSNDSNRVFVVPVAVVPRPPQFQFSFQSAAGAFATAPGGLASAFVSTGLNQEFKVSAFPLPLSLGGLTLHLGGTFTNDPNTGAPIYSAIGSVVVPLLYAGPQQINFQIPPTVPAGDTIAKLDKPDGSSVFGTATILSAFPGIFTVSQTGSGQAAALNQDYSSNSPTNPAARGSVFQLFLTGAGATIPALGTGEAADPTGNKLVLTQVQPAVSINGQSAKVSFSGMAPGFVGLWQINVQIPDNTPPALVPLVVSAGGMKSNSVIIAVK